MKKSPNAIDVHVGSRIRFRRTTLGLSQEKLGDGLGITFQQIQKYEKGTNRVGASRLQNVAEILNVPISFFFEGSPGALLSEADATTSSMTNVMNSKECIALAVAFNAIEDKKVRQTILNLVRTLSPAKSQVKDLDMDNESHSTH